MERSLSSLEKAHQGEDEEHDKANLGDQGGGAGEGAETKEGCDQRDNQKDNSVVEHGIGCLELDWPELGWRQDVEVVLFKAFRLRLDRWV